MHISMTANMTIFQNVINLFQINSSIKKPMWFILLVMQHILSEHLLYARHWSLVNKANKTPCPLGTSVYQHFVPFDSK